MKSLSIESEDKRNSSLIIRLLFAAAGLLSTALGIVGVFIPGLPTTIFLIIASYFLTRSCPWLEDRIMNLPFLQAFIPYVRGEEPMPPKAIKRALLFMWAGVSFSLVTLYIGDMVARWVYGVIVVSALIGTVFIFRAGLPIASKEKLPD